ncbi:LEM domain-containing protein 1 [Perognathus longimembris pacificus]|uniref:LEM domain-containing protein 1 n=1 Tax=Perognathus longimembris pacificus TaxID=214514 RepID=UPI0020187495|nr:LEM domain-containing protein 1 [Perognathus longimembris pacificus]
MVDVQCLSNYDLQIHLEQLGFSPGPILPSTRKLYEKKLKQLLVLPPYGQLVVKDLRKLDGFQDDTEEFNIILKGNITFTTEKDKESKKVRLHASREQRHAAAQAVNECSGDCRALPSPTPVEIWLGFESATPPPDTIPKRDLCAVAKSVEDQLPLGLGLAVLGVLIIVVFVYITVENRPLLA